MYVTTLNHWTQESMPKLNKEQTQLDDTFRVGRQSLIGVQEIKGDICRIICFSRRKGGQTGGPGSANKHCGRTEA